MNNPSVLILIPARYASTRFPGKPLAVISGKSMIRRVYESCQKLELDFRQVEIAVVTDDDNIEEHVSSFGGNVVRVNDNVPSGTERICLAYKRFFYQVKWDVIVNVQGDEPLITAEILKELVLFHSASQFEIATVLKNKFGDQSDFDDPNKVKAAFAKEIGKCLYFSRAAIPFTRDQIVSDKLSWFLHIGVYSYRPEALVSFATAGPSNLEGAEKLEQLRAMELGMNIGAIITDRELMGVDVPEDIKILEGVIGNE